MTGRTRHIDNKRQREQQTRDRENKRQREQDIESTRDIEKLETESARDRKKKTENKI